VRSCFLTDTRTVFIESHIAHIVDLVFDPPVVAVEGKQPGWVRLLWGETGDSVDHLRFFLLCVQINSVAVQAEDLCDIGELEVSDKIGAGPDGAGFDATMTLCGVSVLRGEKPRDRGLECLA